MGKTEKHICCICGKAFTGWGNNPYPVVKSGNTDLRCCDRCDAEVVIPTRIKLVQENNRRVTPDEV